MTWAEREQQGGKWSMRWMKEVRGRAERDGGVSRGLWERRMADGGERSRKEWSVQGGGRYQL